MESFFGLVMSSSNSFIGRFIKAVLVGAKTVQGPAVKYTNVRLRGQNTEHVTSFTMFSTFVGKYLAPCTSSLRLTVVICNFFV